MRRTGLILLAALMVVPAAGLAQVLVYQTDFDSLTLGHTQNPALPGHDEWFSAYAVGPAFGEIQNTIANPGQALREYTDATSPQGQQTIDSRPLVDPNLNENPIVTLNVEFYCTSSNLNAANIYSASLMVRDHTHPGFNMIGFNLGGGNGQPKTTTGVGVVIYGFNGVNNNEYIPLTVGQTLAWDTWHTLEMVIDQVGDEYVSITVDGQTQDLTGNRLPYNWDGSAWVRGNLLQAFIAEVVPFGHPSGERTNDSTYWDNLSLTAAPLPCPGDCNCDGLINFDDIDPFVAVLGGATPCRFENCDVNGDGVINFDDIDPFVALLGSGAQCP